MICRKKSVKIRVALLVWYREEGILNHMIKSELEICNG